MSDPKKKPQPPFIDEDMEDLELEAEGLSLGVEPEFEPESEEYDDDM
jgi:hypothetical protein